MATTDAVLEQRIAAVRAFNRFYTQRIGALREHHLESPFPLTGVRVLYELAHWPETGDAPSASVLAARLALDEGYLSRVLRSFEHRGLVRKKPSAADARRKSLTLTRPGRQLFASLEARSRAEVAAILGKLSTAGQSRVVEAMRSIGGLLGQPVADAHPRPTPYVLRPPQPGDIGWVVHRHGVLYAQEYGYDERFEALVAEIAARFVQHFDPDLERCWIAERDGDIVGSVFLVRKTKTAAKLRLLLVEPQVGRCSRSSVRARTKIRTRREPSPRTLNRSIRSSMGGLSVWASSKMTRTGWSRARPSTTEMNPACTSGTKAVSSRLSARPKRSASRWAVRAAVPASET